MVVVFGVDRAKCEHKGCNKKATHILGTSIKQGFNTWVYCSKHFDKHKKLMEE